MPAAGVDDDAAALRQLVQLEGREEQMQDARMIGILDVLEIELPVVRQHLREAAEHDGRAVFEHARDAFDDLVAEVFVERRHVVGEAAEHQTVQRRHAQLAQTVIAEAEVFLHAALAVDAVPERDAEQIALQAVGPGMVDAAEVLRVALVLQANHRAAMRAAVFECIELAVRVARDHHGSIADERAAEVARIRHLGFEAQITPVRTTKDRFLLVRIDFVALEQRIGHARDALGGPLDAGAARRLDGDDVQVADSVGMGPRRDCR